MHVQGLWAACLGFTAYCLSVVVSEVKLLPRAKLSLDELRAEL